MSRSYRAREEARRQHEAADRRDQRMFWTGLVVPPSACAVAALLIGPDSWLGQAAVIAEPFAAAAGVAVVFMIQDRRKEDAPCQHLDLSPLREGSVHLGKVVAFTCTKCHESFDLEAAARLFRSHSVEAGRQWRANLTERGGTPT